MVTGYVKLLLSVNNRKKQAVLTKTEEQNTNSLMATAYNYASAEGLVTICLNLCEPYTIMQVAENTFTYYYTDSQFVSYLV